MDKIYGAPIDSNSVPRNAKGITKGKYGFHSFMPNVINKKWKHENALVVSNKWTNIPISSVSICISVLLQSSITPINVGTSAYNIKNINIKAMLRLGNLCFHMFFNIECFSS